MMNFQHCWELYTELFRNRALATDLESEWTFWETGRLDLMLVQASADSIVKIIAAGWLSILVASLMAGWWSRRRAKARL